MNPIFLRQNLPQNIILLKAQRRIYYTGKIIMSWQILLTVIVTMLFAFLKLIPAISNVMIVIAGVYGFSLTIIDFLFFQREIRRRRINAAKIQEQFDCAVYDLSWNSIFVGSKLSPSLIASSAKEDRGTNKLTDWYDVSLEGRNEMESILVCQQTNLWYDEQLRNRYLNIVLLFTGVVLAILFFVSLGTSMAYEKFWLGVILPAAPVLYLAAKTAIEHRRSITTVNELRVKIDSFKTPVCMRDIRSIQDKIYCSRKDSVLIPEFFYKIHRAKLETDMFARTEK